MNFLDVLRRYGVEHRTCGQHHHCSRGWINLDCPYCSWRESKFRLGYNLAFRYSSCWVCGRVPLVLVLQHITGKTLHECKEIMDDLPREQDSEESLHAGKLTMPGPLMNHGALPANAWTWLRSRGFSSPQLLKRYWDLGVTSPTCGSYSSRLFIPVHHQERVVSWTTRSVGERTPKYLSAPDECSDIPLKNLLYGFDHVRDAVVLVEGPLDVWAGGFGFVGLLGLYLSPARLEMLARIPRRYVCLDNEPEAQEKALKLCRDLSVLPGGTFNVVMETGKDVSRADKEEVVKLRKVVFGGRGV